MPTQFSLRLLCVSATTLLLSHLASAALSTQGVFGVNAELQNGSSNHVGMSRSGRYVAFTSINGGTSNLYVRDIKTQSSVKIPTLSDWNYYAISPNGRYLAYFSANSQAKILDQVSQTETDIPAALHNNIGISDNGYVLFNRTAAAGGQFVLLNLQNQSSKIIAATNVDLGSHYTRNPLSADGQVALFKTTTGYQIYTAANQQTMAFAPAWNGVALASPSNQSAEISLAASGKFIVFRSDAALYRATLQTSSYSLERFDITNLSVRDDFSGLSVSADGRFISFKGNIQMGHPEWAAANAIEPDPINQGYPRILRYDAQLNQLTTMSVAANGGPIRNKADAGSGLWPLVNNTSIISDDGSMTEIATSAGNLIATNPSSGGEQNYHSYVSNGYARNYLFIDMPNSDNNFKAFAPMTLVGNHQWQGLIRFDGVGTESFKFDAGANWNNGVFSATANGAITFGAGSSANQAIANGSNIAVAGGAGTYKVSFNDQTLQYSLTKQADWQRTVVFIYGQTVNGQDLFIRGGIDHNYALSNLGLSCTSSNFLCSIPIKYRNKLNPYTANWKIGDTLLDWYGLESSQNQGNANGLAQGSVLDWTTNNSSNPNKVAINGVGYSPLNTWGDHYWLLDVDMDCSKTVNGWFELKSFISNGPGWEGNVSQVGAPYSSGNHFARCGQLNRFQRGNNSALITAIPQ